MCKDCQCSNIKCNGALVANLDSFVRERKIDVSVFARMISELKTGKRVVNADDLQQLADELSMAVTAL